MELDGVIGKKLQANHSELVNQAELERAAANSADEELRQAQLEKQTKIDRLNRPYEIIKDLFAARGIEWGIMPTSQSKISEKFRIKPSESGIAMSLELEFRYIGDEVNTYNTFGINLCMSSEEGSSKQYMTNLIKPTLSADHMPDGFGMRTYVKGDKPYKLSSYTPRDEEAEWILGALEEAAEIEGIYKS